MVIIPLDEFSHRFLYNPESGILSYKDTGGEAGFDNGNGYRRTSCRYKKFYNHQIIWFLYHGYWSVNEIDHIDGDPMNNRIENLRECRREGNTQNSRKRSHSDQPHKGIRLTRSGNWNARIRANGIRYNLGTYPSPELAFSAYKKKAAELHGEYARFS